MARGVLFGHNNLFTTYPPRLPAYLRRTLFVSVFSLIYRIRRNRALAKYNSRTSEKDQILQPSKLQHRSRQPATSQSALAAGQGQVWVETYSIKGSYKY